MYYLARLFSGQLEKGESYGRIARTVGISLCDFVLFRDQEELHSTFRLHDRRQDRELTDLFELHFIELAKFRRDKPHDLRTPFEKWLHVLKFGELYDAGQAGVPENLKQEEGIEMALDSMRNARADYEVRELIEMRMKAVRDEATRMEQAHQDGVAEGLQRGIERGIERGLEQGLEQGRQTLLATARRMLDEGMPRESVARLTGLRPQDLEG